MKTRKKSYFYWFIFILIICNSAKGSIQSQFWGKTISYIRIESIDKQSINIVKEVIDIKEGDILTIDKVRKSLKHLNLLHRFDQVSICAEPFDNNCMIIFRIEPSWTVRKLKFDFSHLNPMTFLKYNSLSVAQLKRNIPLIENGVFTKKKLDDSILKLKSILFDTGFGHSKITYLFNKNPFEKKLDITFVIDTSFPSLIRTVVFQGNQVFSDNTLLKHIKSKPGKRFSREKMESDTDRIRKYYLKKKYFGVRVYHPEIHFDEQNNAVDITFKIEEGDKLPIVLDIPYHFWNLDWWIYKLEPYPQTLYEILGYTSTDILNYESLKKGLDFIVKKYQDHGFHNAAGYIEKIEKNDFCTYILNIEEGPKVKVHSIHLIGNQHFNDKTLSSFIFTQKNRILKKSVLEEDIESIKSLYAKNGFLDVEVKPVFSFNENNTQIDIELHIKEGNQYILKELHFKGNESFSSEKLMEVLELKPNMPFNPQILDRSIQRLITFYHQNGFAEVSIKKDISSKYKIWNKNVSLTIHEGSSSIIDKIIVTGYKKTQYNVIKRNLPPVEGEPFNSESLFSIQKKLSNTGLFSLVRTRTFPSEIGERNRTVLVHLREFPSLILEAGPGFDTDAGLNGYLSFYTTSLYGTNRYLGSSIFLSNKIEKSQIVYREPEFAGFPIQMEIRFLRNNKDESDYRLLRTGARINWTYHFNNHLRSFLEYRLDNDRPTNISEGVTIPEEYRNSVKIGSLSPGVLYDTRDDPRDPHSGGLYSLKIEFARPVYNSEVDFTKTTLEITRFLDLKREKVLGLSMRIGWGRDLPYQERFKLGGIKTIRGWGFESIKGDFYFNKDGIQNENFLGGNFSTLANIELRFPLFWGLHSVLFLDTGNVWNDMGDFNFNHLKGTLGIGIRFMTPVGPVGIDYGYNIMREDYDNRDRWSFIIGHTF